MNEKEILKELGLLISSYEDLPAGVKVVFQYILQRYIPADRSDATIEKTTNDIYNEIQNHCSTPFDTAIIFLFMKNHGYEFSSAGDDLEFRWLMKAA